MQERWLPGICAGQEAALGGTPGDEGGRVGGEVDSSKRKNSQLLVMEDYDKLISTPRDPTGIVKQLQRGRCCPMCTPRSKSWGRTNHDEPRSRRTSSISSDRRRGARSAEPSRGLSLPVQPEGWCWLRAPGGAVNTRSIHHTTSLDPKCLGQT